MSMARIHYRTGAPGTPAPAQEKAPGGNRGPVMQTVAVVRGARGAVVYAAQKPHSARPSGLSRSFSKARSRI